MLPLRYVASRSKTLSYSLFENEENRKQEKMEKKSEVHKECASSFKYQAKYKQQLILEELGKVNQHMASNQDDMSITKKLLGLLILP